jgi:hypothetical protein
LDKNEVAQVEKLKKPAALVDLMSALKHSLAQIKGRKKPVVLHKEHVQYAKDSGSTVEKSAPPKQAA